MESKSKINYVSLIARLIAAVLMLQTLYFKFTASEESVYIFTTLNMEPLGRIGSGIGELVASILLLIPATCWIGAILGLGLMSGAILAHLTLLGIVVMDDGGQLFIYGLIVFICCTIILFIHKKSIFEFVNKLKPA